MTPAVMEATNEVLEEFSEAMEQDFHFTLKKFWWTDSSRGRNGTFVHFYNWDGELLTMYGHVVEGTLLQLSVTPS